MDYRPQSPDLSLYAPQSPDLSGLPPPSRDPRYGATFSQQHQQHNRFGGAFSGGNGFARGALSYQPTSVPSQQAQYDFNTQQSGMASSYGAKSEDDEYLPDAPAAKRVRNGLELSARGSASNVNGLAMGDPTLGVHLKTSFPVARIKRIMQADEDIGKVAQVTPHVVSRALELFMIRLISASADQARGNVSQASASGSGGDGGGKGPRKVLAQHMKKAIMADVNFDFLNDIAGKVPDAPAKAAAKVKEGSDSEDAKPKKRAPKKRKDSGDSF